MSQINKHKFKNVQEILDFYYDAMFHDLCKLNDEDLYEFKIEVKISADGLTVTRSWLDRDEMLKEKYEEM